VDNGKHKPQDWHHQNPNITTVQMLTVLLQWQCGKLLESEISDLYNNGYVIASVAWYTYRALQLELIVHYE
jgi:hypothetical protein